MIFVGLEVSSVSMDFANISSRIFNMSRPSSTPKHEVSERYSITKKVTESHTKCHEDLKRSNYHKHVHVSYFSL